MPFVFKVNCLSTERKFYCTEDRPSWGLYRVPRQHLREKKGLFFSRAPFVFFKWSHAVLSVIFGIFGTFGIEIGTRKKIGRKIFRRKKIRKRLVEIFLGPQKFDFFPEKFSLEKSMKIQNFEILKIFRNIFEISKCWIVIDFFIDFFFREKIEIFWSQKKIRPNVFWFFSTKNFPTNFFWITYFDPKFSKDSKNHT